MCRLRNIAVCAVAMVATLMGASAADGPRGLFTDYSAIDGLAHNNIHDIHIDSRGYVWLCTWSGVSRFDGYDFRNYCNDPKQMPVRHNRFRSVVEDSAGNLWFRTYDDHLYLFNPEDESFRDLAEDIANLSGNAYRCGKLLCCKHSARVWVEYQGYGLVGYLPSDTKATINLIDNKLIGTRVNFLEEDDYGTVWATTRMGGVVSISPEGEVEEVLNLSDGVVAATVDTVVAAFATEDEVVVVDLRTHQQQLRKRLGQSKITSLAMDNDHAHLFVGTTDKGVYSLRLADGKVERFTRGTQPARIRSMEVDSHGTVWITDTKAGITRLDTQKRDYKHFSQPHNTVKFYSDTTSVVLEKDDLVWLKMNRVGFGYYDRQEDQVKPFYNNPSEPDCRMTNGVATFEVDDNGVLWLSTYYERGLQRIVLLTQESSSMPLGTTAANAYSDEIRSLKCDHNGNTWVGTKEGQLYCYSPERTLLHHYKRTPWGAPIGPIYTIEEDKAGNIWVGTKGNGAYRLTPSASGHHSFKHFQHHDDNPRSLSNNQVYCIEEDGEGRIWIATYGGGINMLPSAQSEEFYNHLHGLENYPMEECSKARYILSDSPTRMLVGTSEGLIVFNPAEEPNKALFDIYQRDPEVDNSLQANDVIHILKDSQQRVWLSTYGGGLSLIEGYDLSGRPQLKTYTTSDGLPSNILLAATESQDGALWLTTESNIVRLDTKSGIFTTFSRQDGLGPMVYNETTAITDQQGNILVGGVSNNLQIVDPKQMVLSDYNYRLRLTSVKVQNNDAMVDENYSLERTIREGTPLKLKHNYLLLSVDFAVLNFRLQNRVSYMFMLEGYDSHWTTARNISRINYSKVPHGHYTLRVKAFVDNPEEASEEVQLPIHILAPWWAQWWAICIYVALVMAILWLIAFLYLRVAKLRTQARVEQEATEMKLKFFTNISHELRTPLTLIMGGIEEVQRHENLSERAESSLNLSYKNSKRMLSLINQLLDFRKVVKNKMDLCVSRLDIVKTARGVLDDFRDLADERRVELMFSVSREEIIVWADREKMESLFYNLLSNAMKFTRDKGCIELSLTQREEEGTVVIAVKDSGVGIPKELVADIFDRFVQHSSAVRGDTSGSGIGLALSKEIVELHKGTIGVESKVGVGSTFTIRLPMGNSHFSMEQIDFQALEGAAATTDEQPASPRRKNITPPSGAEKIVLAEDNNEMRAFIYNNLADTYEVVEAVDGQDALEKVSECHPDIVITDLMMPKMDGIELTEQIRKNFETSHIPIIMLTAKQTPEERIKAMKYGADAYITKPFSMELLMVRIDNLLSQRRTLFEKMSNRAAGGRVVEIQPKDVVVTNRDEEFLKRLMGWMEENIENSDLTIDDLAGHLRLGRTTLYNKIKSLTGKSPVELIKEYRVTKSELLLRTGQFSVSEVAYKVGFSDPSYFSRCFKEQYKSSPVEYLKKLNIKQL